ncbi:MULTISPECIES: tonB-system energizer ExbB [Enterobacterales]|uniref:tonB-system energizer ExbB n=1 Tax=Enterobacterales TaxID=91347 RepID=UPI0008482A99|nr:MULTISPECIES: tonB-system energizer ExbB [Enterobacterales]MCK9780883.1 tonB-system energizer ExbB [Proteus columbae]MCT6517815.1 tonB-system energizer ExbB [Proteus vulgaris]ODQ06201.1 tonB-system energizer ExbB [Shigella sp. FC130]OEI93713.1 tonB-system energizer ExbB [Shigella sp. FC1655]OEJ07521.1 tonB-system energizer ExbB [Shigella sp. FC1967]
MRNLTASILLAIGLTGSAFADTTPATPTKQPTTAAVSSTATTPTTATPTVTDATTSTTGNDVKAVETETTKPDGGNTPVTTAENSENVPSATENTSSEVQPELVTGGGFAEDLSVMGMYRNADLVVKSVMIGLLLASIVTWALFFAKGSYLISLRRRLRNETAQLVEAKSLNDALAISKNFGNKSATADFFNDAELERTYSQESKVASGIKERVEMRMERRVAAIIRELGRGNGYLATIGAISPFIGLFGTVWGIMNSFIGIAHSQTTNLAVVAPGIAEALLATAIGLIAAIPAVIIYNIFARMIAGYRGEIGDIATGVVTLVSRDLDIENSKAR